MTALPRVLLEPESATEDLRNGLSVLLAWRKLNPGAPLPALDAEAVERRIRLALSKLEGRS